MKHFIWIFITIICANCGFTPVYQKGKSREYLQSIQVAGVDNHESQMLKAALEDGFYGAGKSENKYRLIPNLLLTVVPLSIESSGTTQRYRVVGNATYQLLDSGGKLLTQGSFERFSSYNIASADYSTFVAGNDAKNQVIENAAEEIRLRVIDYFSKATQ